MTGFARAESMSCQAALALNPVCYGINLIFTS